MDKYDEIAARLAEYGVPNASTIMYSAKQVSELVAEAACARHLPAILARAVGAPGSGSTQWADEVRRIAREEIAGHVASLDHAPSRIIIVGPAIAAESPAPTPADEKCDHGVRGCKGRGEKHWPELSERMQATMRKYAADETIQLDELKRRVLVADVPENVWLDLDTDTGWLTESTTQDARAINGVPNVLFIRADVVEKRVAEAVDARDLEWHEAIDDAEPGIVAPHHPNEAGTYRLFGEQNANHLKASLAAAEARVREAKAAHELTSDELTRVERYLIDQRARAEAAEAKVRELELALATEKAAVADRDAESAAAIDCRHCSAPVAIHVGRCAECWARVVDSERARLETECQRVAAERDALRGTLLDVRNERNELEADLANTVDREKALQAQHETDERAIANLRTELVEYLAANADSDARREADAKEMAELRADRDEYRRVYHAMCDAMKVKA